MSMANTRCPCGRMRKKSHEKRLLNKNFKQVSPDCRPYLDVATPIVGPDKEPKRDNHGIKRQAA